MAKEYRPAVRRFFDLTTVIRRLPDREKAKVPIVAMTANAFAEDRRKALDMGMNAHLAKPLEIEKLVAVATELLDTTGEKEDT